MPRELKWRLFVIVAVTLFCMLFIFPTARYFSYVSGGEPPTEPEQREAWEAKADEIKRKSIKLGLDLQGGVDILLEVDLEKTAADLLRSVQDTMRRSFQREGIDASFALQQRQRALRVTLADPKDFPVAKAIIERSAESFESYDIEQLKSGPLTLVIEGEMIQKYADEAIEGANKVVRRRVDELGLTQPSVARQGENRIRLQLPGERNPEYVVRNIVRPARLEFRLVHENHTEKIAELFDREENEYTLKPGASLPPGYTLRWGKHVYQDPNTGRKTVIEKYPFIVREKIELTGKYLRNAWMEIASYDPLTPVHVNLEFDRKGAAIFKEVTENNINRQLSILLDNFVYSAPVIEEVIPLGRCFIRGDFTTEEGRELSVVLKAGALPATLKVIEKKVVEATLGTESIKASLKAVIYGALAVGVFAVIYYGGVGLIAIFSILLNVFLILAVLSLARATLTLSGIGGILLTIGMAIDGNVLIYERIREELRTGKPIKVALRHGFGRAFSVIFDSNLTTLITALVLLQFAEGSVKGFALTMSIGLLANLYTSLTVTRALMELWLYLKDKISMGKLQLFSKPEIPFMSLRNFSLPLSLLIIAICLGGLIVNKGPSFAVDFSGGVLSDVEFSSPVGEREIRDALREGGLSGERVQKVMYKEEFLIRVPLIEDNVQGTQAALERALEGRFGEEAFQVLSTKSIGNEVGSEFRSIALTAVIIAVFCILVYVGIRFKFRFGVAAVIALIHDVFITFGLISLLRVDISLDVVSALLIALGYSINDTIVIFDRIRENLRTVYGKSFREIAELSINQSLNRTLITSLTTLFVVLAMYVFGGKGLQPFALTIIIGIIFGTYSSSFVATPILYEWTERQRMKAEGTGVKMTAVRPANVR